MATTPSWQDAHLAAVTDLGYSEREARFIITVALFSGHFLRAHYVRFADIVRGRADTLFINRALGFGHVTEYDYQYRKRLIRRYHVHFKGIYRRVGNPESRLRRRDVPITYINAHLGILDYVIDNIGAPFLIDEQARVKHFTDTLGLPLSALPAKTYTPYGGRQGEATTVYFVDRYPLIADPLTFTYVEEFGASPASFRTHLAAYAPLFRALASQPWRLDYITPNEGNKAPALAAWNAMLEGYEGSAPDGSSELQTYFLLQDLYERKEWKRLSKADLQERLRLDKLYGSPQYREQFQAWRSNKTLPQTHQQAQQPAHAPTRSKQHPDLVFYFPGSLRHASL